MEKEQSEKPDTSKFYLWFLVFAALLYIGSYYLLVRKQEKPVVELWNLNAGRGSSLSSAAGSKPQYLWNTSAINTAFTPIHWVDRRIRKEFWGPDGVVWEEPDRSQFDLH